MWFIELLVSILDFFTEPEDHSDDPTWFPGDKW